LHVIFYASWHVEVNDCCNIALINSHGESDRAY
jgi:hypothetical protein